MNHDLDITADGARELYEDEEYDSLLRTIETAIKSTAPTGNMCTIVTSDKKHAPRASATVMAYGFNCILHMRPKEAELQISWR